jgi:HEAT repeat protein
MVNWVMKSLFIVFLIIAAGDPAAACPACWAGYGPGAERFNKVLADLRIMYEIQGREALPQIKKVLKQSNDPLVQKRAIEYIADLEDTAAIPLLEDILYDLVKRVSFSVFGVDSIPFQTRLSAAHALANLGVCRMAEKIWDRYDRIDPARKSEVPYLLNALGDPELNERLSDIVNRCEDHQLMVGALDVLAIGGNEKVLPFLKQKIDQWRRGPAENSSNTIQFSSVEYSVWRIKAEQAIMKIEERCKY